MPEQVVTKRAFSSYTIDYAITNPNGKDYARIDFFNSEGKVGQILFGSSIVPGSYAALLNADEEVHLYFPMDHFETILTLLQTEKGLALYVERDIIGDTATVSRGGLMPLMPTLFASKASGPIR